MKKIFLLLAVFLIVASVFCGCSGEESIVSSSDISSKPQESPITDFEYEINEHYKEKYKFVTITKYAGNDEYIVIPGKIENYPVEVIDYSVFEEKLLKSVSFPDTVTMINSYAFRNCTKLTEIDFGEGLTAIGGNAFDGCTSLKRLILPENLDEIDEKAFANCTSLEYVFIPKNAGGKGYSSFENNTSLKTIEFEEGSTWVGGIFSFANCTALNEVTIPASTEGLREYSFVNCPNLKKVVFLGDAPKEVQTNVFGKPNKEIKIYYNKNTSGWENCPLAEDYTLVAQ